MASNLSSPTVDQQILPEAILRLNAKMNLVYPGGILGPPLTEVLALSVPILLLHLSLSQILSLLLSLPPPPPLRPQSLFLTTLTQTLAQTLTQSQT